MGRLAFPLLVILAIVLAVTNPKEDAHKQAVNSSIAKDATDSKLLARLATDVLNKADVVPIKYNNYYVFSTATVDDKVASIGICSRVWKLK